MAPKERERRSQLFTVRLWIEDMGEGRTEHRGVVRHVLSGATWHFRDWEDLRNRWCRRWSATRPPSGDTGRGRRGGTMRQAQPDDDALTEMVHEVEAVIGEHRAWQEENRRMAPEVFDALRAAGMSSTPTSCW